MKQGGKHGRLSAAVVDVMVNLVLNEGHNYSSAGRVMGIDGSTVRRYVVERLGTDHPGLPGRVLRQSQIDLIIQLVVDEGYTYAETARATGLSTQAITKYVEAAGHRSHRVRHIPESSFERAQALIENEHYTVIQAAYAVGIHVSTLTVWRNQHGKPRLKPRGRTSSDPLTLRLRAALADGPKSMQDLFGEVADVITPGHAIRAAEVQRANASHTDERTVTRSTEQLIEIGKKVIFRERVSSGTNTFRKFTCADGTRMIELRPPTWRKAKSDDSGGDIV